MKPHYDFSKGERRKFYAPDTVFITPQEADLLQEIAQSLSQIEWGRYHELIHKRQTEVLNTTEQDELISLSNQIEEANANRIEDVARLAERRKTTLPAVMQELGLKPEAVSLATPLELLGGQDDTR